ncbi:MAG: thioredoxin fold domain-containing protein [Deltaproteobacteria bacterium]|nr:thioredoxin fold domain-containing protein [Deltaproteobacteria bacterium]
MAIELNRDTYESTVEESATPMVVDFWGPQCKPCLALMPSIEELENVYGDKIKVAKLNAAENRMLCAKLRVMGLPTFIFYKGGEEVKRINGEDITKEQIKAEIDALLT